MLTKEDLLVQNTIPIVNNISLKLYKEFSEEILLKRKFHYYFEDNSEITVEFREWGIYHMLAIQHINYKIDKEKFFEEIDKGFDLLSFKADVSMNNRYKGYKTRIAVFSCIYDSLLNGIAFYLPSGKVKNTSNVKADYIIYNNIDGKGINYGLQKKSNAFVPVTILIAKSKSATRYLEESKFKLIKRVDVLDENGNIIESRTHNTQVNPLEENKSSDLNDANNIKCADETESDTESTTSESTKQTTEQSINITEETVDVVAIEEEITIETTADPEPATTPQQEVAATTEQATTEQAITDHLSSNQD